MKSEDIRLQKYSHMVVISLTQRAKRPLSEGLYEQKFVWSHLLIAGAQSPQLGTLYRMDEDASRVLLSQEQHISWQQFFPLTH